MRQDGVESLQRDSESLEQKLSLLIIGIILLLLLLVISSLQLFNTVVWVTGWAIWPVRNLNMSSSTVSFLSLVITIFRPQQPNGKIGGSALAEMTTMTKTTTVKRERVGKDDHEQPMKWRVSQTASWNAFWEALRSLAVHSTGEFCFLCPSVLQCYLCTVVVIWLTQSFLISFPPTIMYI